MARIGKNIQKIRQIKNISQSYMAAKLDISQGTYSKMENEELGIRDELFEQIAELLEVDKKVIERFDESIILNNNIENVNDQAQAGGIYTTTYNYNIDPEVEEGYKKQIKLLEEQNAILQKQLDEMKKNDK